MYLFLVWIWKEKIPVKNTEPESDIPIFYLMEHYVKIIYVPFEHDLHIVNDIRRVLNESISKCKI